jgi:hypothetical protein
MTLTLLGLELLLRLLPLNEGARLQSVDHDQPVRRLEPERTFVWSGGWNFPVINHVRTNNYGFVKSGCTSSIRVCNPSRVSRIIAA